ncbi:hypothetical protein HZS_7731 [Henneguya salminicola]|nr:hypothetical protein HZS_7731 [Henneguya salminicola]
MKNNFEIFIPWILLTFFLILQLIIIIILIYCCSRAWKNISIKLSSKNQSKNDTSELPLYNFPKNSDQTYLNDLVYSMQDSMVQKPLFEAFEEINNEKVKNILGYAGSIDFFVRFGIIEKIVTFSLLKINSIGFLENSVIGKIKISCFFIPEIQFFEHTFEELPIRHPWSVMFNLKSFNPEKEFFIIYSLNFIDSKSKLNYIGSTIINLNRFMSSGSCRNEFITVNLSSVPLDVIV